MMLPDHRWSLRSWTWAAYKRFILSTDWPVIAGPFHGELGFEVMYWIPFLKQLVADGLDPARLVPIGRGGSATVYDTPTSAELYDLRTPQQIRVENRLQHDRRKLAKQIDVTPFDRAIAEQVASARGFRRYHLLHPAWMYHVLAPYWTATRGMHWLGRHTKHEDLPAVPLPDGLTLPDVFVAVRFYTRPTFPDSMLTRQLVEATVQTIANHTPVVVLDSGFSADDHRNVPIGSAPVLNLGQLCQLTPQNNLAIQLAVMAKAQALVGTYGGFAQAASRLGRPVMSFYTEWTGACIAHRHLSEWLAVVKRVPFFVYRLQELPFVKAVLPQVEVQSTPQENDGQVLGVGVG